MSRDYIGALETVIAAARDHAQAREDDADMSIQERRELDELWRAIDIVQRAGTSPQQEKTP